MLPGLDKDNAMIRGELLELDLSGANDDKETVYRSIVFDMEEVLKNDITELNNGCLEVFIEIMMIPKDSMLDNESTHNNDYSNPISDIVFGNKDVLKIKPGFAYSSVADPSTFKFNTKSYVYKEQGGEYFHQKDIELVENQVQTLDIILLQNFATSSHLLGMLIEAPLEGNHDTFMHGESKPDCIHNECIFGDKTFNGNSLNYVFNANVVSRIRLWFYKMADLTTGSYSKGTPYHFSIKSTKNYLDTHAKEKVACLNEVFPTKITSRRYAHKEMPDAYIVDDYFRVDSFTDVSFSGKSQYSSSF